MGYIRHNAIVVTSCLRPKLMEAYAKAHEIFPWVSGVSPVVVNGYLSFFIPPDGSKEGWEDSDTGDDRRKEFMDWCSDPGRCLEAVGIWYDEQGESGIDYNFKRREDNGGD